MKPPSIAPSWRSRAEGLGLLAVVALLVVLAVVQHRWLSAIAEAERKKLTEEAHEKAAAIAQDIDRELTRAFLELRVDARALAPASGPGPAAEFAGRVARFREESAHAALVKAIYVAERPEEGPSHLSHFDEAGKKFEDAPWPAVLEPVQAAIDAGGVNPLPGPLGVHGSLPPVLADVPAILTPVMDVLISEPAPDPLGLKLSRFREMFMRHAGRGPIQILLLDPQYLKEKLVAGVVKARLGVEGPFHWSVLQTDDGAAIAGESEPGPGEADAKAALLQLRFDDLDRSLLRGVLPGLPEGASATSMRFVVQLGTTSSAALHISRSSKLAKAPWTLALRHREGSIDAAVTGQQRRNALLSGSILGVLGLSAGLVFFSARKLRALATQQVEFVAAVSHELRTPLAVIRSAADNLADGVVQETDQARRYGALIRDESIRLTDMVEHVLEFAGADSPGRAVRGPVDVVEAARVAVKDMEGLAAEREALVVVEAPETVPKVNGDLSHLTRAISNLLGNALKYGGLSPRVTVRVARGGEGVEVSVADQGEGLTPSEIPRLFEPFYRGQRASEAQIPGSGLGLALVKRIVESHGGRVSARNGAAGGAFFAISLPAA